LTALIPDQGPVGTAGVDEIHVDSIVPNPHQPRSTISEEALAPLIESIREHGVIQPLLVTETDITGRYQLIAGERRWQAARLAGLTTVPVVVKEAASRDLLELALVENLQREDLSALEEANAYQRLTRDFGLTQDEVAQRVGRSRTAVSNALRLLALSDTIKQSLASGEITEGHARALLGIEGEWARHDAWRIVVDRKLSVRQTEELVRRWPARPGEQRPAAAMPADPAVATLESRVREAVGTKVELRRRSSGKGRLILHFYSDEELEGILGRLGVSNY
jgi:ParB family chromosome partitioning protein